MSDLETHAKRIIGPLLNDFALPLKRAEQWLISMWGIKTAMVFECTSPRKQWFYSDVERQTVSESYTPPTDTIIWLGRYVGSESLSGEGRSLFRAETKGGVTSGDGHVTTLVIRHLVIHLVTFRPAPQFKAAQKIVHVKSGPWNQSLIQIWPLQNAVVRWPPRLSFSDYGTTPDELNQRFVPKRKSLYKV